MRNRLGFSLHREKNEVDFVITYGGNRYLPIEVKHRKPMGVLSRTSEYVDIVWC
jgi:hypothetical protein